MLSSIGAFTFLFVVLMGLVGAPGVPAIPVQTSLVWAHRGDTLRGIAERFAPGSDPREVARRIVELNGLAGSGLKEGRWLEVPVSAPLEQ